ncbi:MAG: glycosyltransferase family 2 protein, partial [Paraglaciecola sp.]|nr:glycosyltransferase family 2 protein [Paraglaciecola sp.]
GAFLVFKSSIYEQLAGFDTSYFMYYEDVDICLRYYKISGHGICFLKNIHATHIGAYQNRRFFSKHFFWYLRSLARFLKRK